jgi:hypothetical protein
MVLVWSLHAIQLMDERCWVGETSSAGVSNGSVFLLF